MSQLEDGQLAEACRVLESQFGFDDPGNSAGILGYGFGWIRREDRWIDQRGLVLLAKKGSPGFPERSVSMTLDGEEHDVPCCSFMLDPISLAVAPAAPVRGSPPLRLGAPIARRAGFASATWGCFFNRDGEDGFRYALTVAHAFDTNPDDVFCGRRKVGTAHLLHGFDAAVVKLLDEAAADVKSEVVGGRGVVGAGTFEPRHFDERCSVYRPTQRKTFSASVRAAGMTLHRVDARGGVKTQREMLMIDTPTSHGDSGAALVDARGNAIGLLSGGQTFFSFFMSVSHLLRNIAHLP
jgi:hypothetical protein